ncbi:MAG TPA: polysaccharide pyruvyl transferase family protein [Chthonomonadaceae bacterium]|nr:polysaccharide pyruvyl transferase family protein [Chthonomonadaceae bacterium]
MKETPAAPISVSLLEAPASADTGGAQPEAQGPAQAALAMTSSCASAARPFRVLILDNVIVNAGDAAILLAMKGSLEATFGPQTVVHSGFSGPLPEPGIYRTFYPELTFVPTLANAAYTWIETGLWPRLVRKTALKRFLWSARTGLPLLLPRERQLLREYREADLIVVSGGACLSTSWTSPRARKERIAKYRLALALGKPLVFYAMSVGPFVPDDPLPGMLRPVMERAAAILCRDAESVRVVREQVGVKAQNVHQTIDEALLLAPRPPQNPLAPPRKRPLRLGICVHQWHWLGDSDPERRQRDFEGRMAAVCRSLLERHAAELVFLTTHQGVAGIQQDDDVSQRIWEQLPADLQPYAHVLHEFVRPDEFAYFMGQCDLVLSSRLHGGILGLVGGAPILALEYEPKTRGLMRQLDLEDCVLSMRDSSAEEILRRMEAMLRDLPETKRRHRAALERGQALARRNCEIVRAALRHR